MKFAILLSLSFLLAPIYGVLAQGVAPPLSGDMATIYARRVTFSLDKITGTSSIGGWLSSLGSNGKWPDNEVDYTTGCAARRANWPAEMHWRRILTMAGAWTGRVGGGAWTNNAQLRDAISSAMSYWYSRDFIPDNACIDLGGTNSCPCSNPRNTLWNTNWFSNVILIPNLVARTCLILRPSLTAHEYQICTDMTVRTFSRFGTGAGYLAGANILEVGRISIDSALITANAAQLASAFGHIHNEVTVDHYIKADGIRGDGAFAQHAGVLYNGGYGKDYINTFLELELAAVGTSYASSGASKGAIETFFAGTRFTVIRNSATGNLHWDLSVINRFISFPVIDNQATSGLHMNLTTVQQLGSIWNAPLLLDFANSLSGPPENNANAGSFNGNKLFFTNDYMIHRGPGYVTTLKMFSSRTLNSECINTQNPKGFHLSDGAMYTYVRGSEYEDIAAAWDWDLIPGITTDYQATPLDCASTTRTGVENFVGGVSDWASGIAVMRYTNPMNGKLKWQKAWFFLDSGVIHVMVNILASTSGAPVHSVLEQKRLSGKTYINGVIDAGAGEYNNLQTIWHNGVLWSFPGSTSLFLRKGQRTGAWSDIGTSPQPPTTVNMWAAWLQHKNINTPVEYTVFPNVEPENIANKRNTTPIRTLVNNKDYSAIWDTAGRRIMLVFWKSTGGSVVVPTAQTGHAPLTISTTIAMTLIVHLNSGMIVSSDPSQTQTSGTTLTFAFGSSGSLPSWWSGSNRTKWVWVSFPQGGYRGNVAWNWL